MSASDANLDENQQLGSEGVAQILSRFCQAVQDATANEPGLQIYQHNFLATHARALVSNFPLARAYLTPERFDALAEVFASHHVPDIWDINLYDERFPGFVAAQIHGPMADKVPWLAVAYLMRFEYAICQVYYADDLNDPWSWRVQLSREHAETDPRVRYLPPLDTRALWAEFGGKMGILLDLVNDLLNYHYPFIDCLERLTFEQPIRVARAGLRIEVQIVQTNEGVP